MTDPKLTGENVRILRRMRADLDPKAGPLSALKSEALDAVLAPFNTEQPPTRCNMGVGCDEAGTCYASAMGEPERCAARPLSPDTPRAAATLHITSTDTYPDIEVEVHDGALLQPSMSPVPVYAAPRACPELVTLARTAVAAVEHFIKSEERETWTSKRKHDMTAGERIAAGVMYRDAMNKLKEALEKEPK